MEMTKTEGVPLSEFLNQRKQEIVAVNVNDVFPVKGLWCKVVQVLPNDQFVVQVTGVTKQTRKKYMRGQ